MRKPKHIRDRIKKAIEAARLANEQQTKEQKAEDKLQGRAWSKTHSALQLGYDQPVNRQAAKDLSRKRPDHPN